MAKFELTQSEKGFVQSNLAQCSYPVAWDSLPSQASGQAMHPQALDAQHCEAVERYTERASRANLATEPSQTRLPVSQTHKYLY
ncbi:hypothetical protein GCM10027514_21690 [Azotobacter armeniacus]